MSEIKMSTDPLPVRPKAEQSGEGAAPPTRNKYGKLQKTPNPAFVTKHTSSSTSTLKSDGDIGLQKPIALLRSICLLLRFHIESGQALERPILINVFSEVENPLVCTIIYLFICICFNNSNLIKFLLLFLL